MGITFFWIGALIFKEPSAWAGYIASWAKGLLVLPEARVMMLTAIFDIALGLWLLTGIKPWVSGLLATAHLALVLIVVGINAITVRDIGLLAAALSLTINYFPYRKI